ncbi:MAG: hypothetical protein ACPGO3_13225 [Magnetospiraceae bacterium]
MRYQNLELPKLDPADESRIDDYLAEAMRNGNFVSDAEMARELEVSAQTINHWKKKRTLPSERAMIKLADLAGEDREIALTHLAYWNAKTPEVQKAHLNVLGVLYKIKEMAYALPLVFLLSGAPANAGTLAEQSNIDSAGIYIMGLKEIELVIVSSQWD